MVGVDEVLEPDLELLESSSKEVAFILYFPDFESSLFSLLFKRL